MVKYVTELSSILISLNNYYKLIYWLISQFSSFKTHAPVLFIFKLSIKILLWGNKVNEKGGAVKGFGIIRTVFFLHFHSCSSHQKLFLSKLFYFLGLACLLCRGSASSISRIVLFACSQYKTQVGPNKIPWHIHSNQNMNFGSENYLPSGKVSHLNL